MTCPKCASAHTMSTTKEEFVTVRWFIAGRDYAHTERDDKTVVHRCLDCGEEWEA